MKMLDRTRITRYVGAAIAAMGIGVIALGVFFVTEGFAAKEEVQSAMAAEQVTVTIDEVKVPVTDQETAMAMAEVITGHTLGTYGPWQGMERDDPHRASMLDGLTLRNSLMLGRMALDVSELVTGLGAVIAVMGVAFTATGGIVIALAGGTAREETAAGTEPVAFTPDTTGYDQAA